MKKILIIVPLILVLVLTGCTLKKKTEENKTEASPQGEEEESIMGSLKDLLNRGKNLKCTLEKEQSDKSKMKMTFFVSGNKFKQEVSFDNPSEEQKKLMMQVVSDGKWMYFWNEQDPKNASKMELAKLEQNKEKSQEIGSVDWEKQYDYKCRAWSGIGVDFNPPAGIEFKDLTAMMEQLNNTGKMDQVQQDVCALCYKAPTPQARTECLKNAKCIQYQNQASESTQPSPLEESGAGE